MTTADKLTALLEAATPGPLVARKDEPLRWRISEASSLGTLAYMTARPFAHGKNFSHEQIAANARLLVLAVNVMGAVGDVLVTYRALGDSCAVSYEELADDVAALERAVEEWLT